MRLPIKALRGGRNNRCILTVQPLRNAPAICGPLLYQKDKHFRVRPASEAGHCACAYDSAGAAPSRWLAQPRGLSGNRRRARKERGKHEERDFLRAETSVDIVGEGGCGRGQGVVGRWTPGWLPACHAFPRSSFLCSGVPGSHAFRQLLVGVGQSHKFPQRPAAPWTTRGHHTHSPPYL